MNTKIVYFTPAFFPENSGYGNATTGFVSILAQAGQTLAVVTPQELPKDVEEIKIDGVDVHRIASSKRMKSLILVFRAYSYIKRNFPDRRTKVFIESGELPLLAFLLQRYYGRERVIMRIHGCYETEFLVWRGRISDTMNRLFLGCFLRRAKRIVSTNSYHINFIIDHYLDGNRLKAARKFLSVIPNAVTLINQDSAKSFPENRKEVAASFLTLGRMSGIDAVGQKGFEDLIAAWDLIPALLHPGESIPQLVVIGKGSHRRQLETMAEALGIEKSVVFIDGLSRMEVFASIKSALACILPSRYEGFSMFAAEVVANGAILIGTKSTGLVDLIDQGKSGFLVAPHSPIEIAESVLKVMRLSAMERQEMQKFAEGHFSRIASPQLLAKAFETTLS